MDRVQDRFAGKVALITGGASGIGRALGEELVRRGARVVLADVNREGAEEAARAISGDGNASGVELDVRDAVAVERRVNEVVTAHGRLDYIFNNAGIAIMGEARYMTLADWNRLIDVNLRGVVHGVGAAYPLMIRQGFGHIVNTASVAGLAPTPGATGYSMTKHAVVGLSISLRGEAARFGVKVSVVCPGFVDTPIKDATQWLNVDRDAVLQSLPVGLYPANSCARDVLKAVERNRAVIVVTAPAKLGWWLYRMAPKAWIRIAQHFAERSPLLTGRGVKG